MSSESIASQPPTVVVAESCRACGAPLADDQRYCLQCGERRFPISSVLLAGPGASASPSGPDTAGPAGAPVPADAGGRGNAVTVIAGVGVLLLAMGVGVLIGRAGSSKPSAAPAAQVVSVATTPGTVAGASSEAASFTSDWPAAKSGYTVQLQTLPVAGTQMSAVQDAKSAAGAKGAKDVGALKSGEFTSLKPGSYVIYSGVFDKQAEAAKALAGLKKSFPGASVVKVANGATGSSAPAGGAAGGAAVGHSLNHPAPPSVVESLHKPKAGKSYEEQSKNLPDVISTG